MIIGSPGAGKTTLAKQIGAMLDIEVIHLDWLFWKEGWQKTVKSERTRILYPIIQRDRWVLDGTYKNTLDARLKVADCVIFLDISRYICLWRVIKRRILYIGKQRPEVAPGCPDKVDWDFLRSIWLYPAIDRKFLHQKLDAYHDKLVIKKLQTTLEVKQFSDEKQFPIPI